MPVGQLLAKHWPPQPFAAPQVLPVHVDKPQPRRPRAARASGLVLFSRAVSRSAESGFARFELFRVDFRAGLPGSIT